MLLNCGVGEDSWESLGLQGDPTSPSKRKSVLNIHWKDWYWSWNSSTLATWCKKLTHWKRPWCWERLKAGGEGDDRGWDVWMASQTQWTWVWVGSGSWWWTRNPGVLQSMGLQRVRHDWATELNWTGLDYSMPAFPVFHYLLEFAQTHVHWVRWVSDAISVGKESTCNVGDHPQCRRPGFNPWVGKIPVSGRSPGEGNGNPLQYSCLGNLMDRGAWWAIVHRVTRVGHNLVTNPPTPI